MKPSFERNQITNDLSSNRPPNEIAKAIIDLASELKSEKSGVSINYNESG